MSDEEIALKTLKEVASDDFDTLGDDISPKMAQNILNVIDKQQKEIKDWFEIADNILRATNDYGNISIGYIPKYIDKLQKNIEELKKWHDIFLEMYIHKDKVGANFISKDKIREKIKHYNNELEHIKNGEEFENEKPMYYWGKVALENLLEEN